MSRKPIFDAVRRLLGRGFTPAEVRALDALLDDAGVRPDPPSEPEKPFVPTNTSAEGLALIHRFEGFHKVRPDGRVEAYRCPAGVWTIGHGLTRGPDGQPIRPGTVWTRAEAEREFARQLVRYEQDVIRALGDAIHRTSQEQFDALVAFHFNTGAIARATLTAKHRAGDTAGAAAEFGRWTRAGGKVLPGLVRRRNAEADLYRKGSR
ncbi:lysozyme [Erythrobacteraceae bacterium CFH 75059]|uniref:lysozyme n=1 Tax=Qipengyuania thermophila TaxID=2509361 RepID=UPI00101F6F2F|nr:lysozyme [Qipengyuania thermophila]TCD04283.1 lysozyme [Erythrobacteraceae bacterium CFH 75059]